MKVNRVACVTEGLIGQGWASLFTWEGHEVDLQGLREKALERALSQMRRASRR